MKKHFSFTLCLALTFTLQSYAAVITVSNTPNTVAMYSTMASALTVAAVGDTILVSPSGTSYGNVTINKDVHIIGANTGVVFSDAIFATNVTGGSLQGVELTGQLYGSGNPSSVLVRHCNLERIVLSNTHSFLFVNNIVKEYLYGVGEADGVMFSNNTFVAPNVTYPQIQSAVGTNSVIFTNNIFIMQPAQLLFQTDQYWNVVFQNNIVLGVLNNQLCYSSSFSNNIANSWGDLNLNVNNNTESQNFIGQTPVFFNWDNTFEYGDDDLRLAPASPGVNGGTDGSDIGPFGGAEPLTVSGQYGTFINGFPYVTFMQLNELIVPLNSDIEVQATGTIISE